ncbi:unnamed protein product [Didymodactylos carnosus]|uniref:SMB domain-containing protein n=1 Tax=Didymodactylos carnosus TaxID=1234261 RepID=A0A813VG43_9BILA|nr:unnamed protein product [Didymodactylos carnosus]CAF0845185.1 unnamed protein product [Didymodactylos carnosus]CAF3630232.1 unnamed protein product [Didymodactylos carnosus]CAF3630367.1 unnamed protein product [Didymodactylos carnosus]
MKLFIVVVVLLFITVVNALYSEWEEIRPYCGARSQPQCCTSRNDNCFMPYYDSRCYCDTFCFRAHDNHDCCPDHDAICEGKNVTEPVRPPPQQTGTCIDQETNRIYEVGGSIKRDCNLCRCTTLGYRADWSCEEDLCVNSPELLQHVKQQQPYTGWDGTHYDKFNGVKVRDALKYYLGTIPDPSLRSMVEKAPDDPADYYRMDDEKSFDTRTNAKYQNKIRGIRDQGKCGISWALSTVDVASDRLSLVETIHWTREPLSVQNVLSCTDPEAKDGCEGGRVAFAWGFIKDKGVITDNCYPYESGTTGNISECRFRLTDDNILNIQQHRKLTNIQCPSGATNGQHYNFGPAYRVRNEPRSVKYEIYFRGPVQATMLVTPDFFLYKNGIYKCQNNYDRQNPRYANLNAHHSIRLLGWGTAKDPRTQQDESYWIAANSWGEGWGQNGYFHIRFGDCQVEETVIATYGKSTEVLKQKQKRQKRSDEQDNTIEFLSS